MCTRLSIASTRTSNQGADASQKGATAFPPPAQGLLVTRPTVVYTVPTSKLGWRGRSENGEDPALWYDSDGVRNGPPANYWRQAMDERNHKTAMEIVDKFVERKCSSLPDVQSGDVASAAEIMLKDLELCMGIRKPLLNRKLLGRWATIVFNGRLAASPADKERPTELRVHATIELERKAGRKTVEHRYGTFDDHLEAGEVLQLRLLDGAPAKCSSGFVGQLAAGSAADERMAALFDGFDAGATLPFSGRISLLNEYLLVRRDEQTGNICDVLMRLGKQG